MSDYRDVISAFADQEPVDVEQLSAALADPEAREYFMDILLLRGMVGDADPVESGRKQKEQRPQYRALAAAALIAIGLGTGYIAARATLDGNDAQASGDATVAPATRANQEVRDPSAQAPAPTHVIRMENGVDWNERSGGK
jgi:hypothetical protein